MSPRAFNLAGRMAAEKQIANLGRILECLYIEMTLSVLHGNSRKWSRLECSYGPFRYCGTSCCQECWQGHSICETGRSQSIVDREYGSLSSRRPRGAACYSLIVPKPHKKTSTVHQTWHQLTTKRSLGVSEWVSTSLAVQRDTICRTRRWGPLSHGKRVAASRHRGRTMVVVGHGQCYSYFP